jgi:glutathione S-transferase
MTLTLHFHPLSSYCHKVLIALYENGTPFEPQLLNLGDPAERQRYRELWPIGKMPILRDTARDRILPESSIIIEYLDRHYPGIRPLIPAEAEPALEARLWDRLFDLYVMTPMQQIVGDRIRPAGSQDPHGVAAAEALLRTSYGVIEQSMADRAWAAGSEFSVADCAAAPSLFFAETLVPFSGTHRTLTAYFERLTSRASVQRVLEEAKPFLQYYPFQDRIAARFR